MNTKPRENLNGPPKGLFVVRNTNEARLKQIGMDSPQTVNFGPERDRLLLLLDQSQEKW